MILTTLVTHMGEMDYLLPVKVSEDLKGVTGEDWIDLLRQIAQCGLYDVLILDLDEGLQEVYQILRILHTGTGDRAFGSCVSGKIASV